MLLVWLSSSFNFYLLRFELKHIPGDIFLNTGISSMFEIIAYLVSGVFYVKIGLKRSLIISYVFSGAASTLLIFFDTIGWLTPVLVLSAKYGIS